MAKLAITAAIALLCASALAQAGGHTEAEAQIEKLQQEKKILATRLSNAIAFSKERATQLEAANSRQAAMSTGITSAIAQSKKKSAQIKMLQQQLTSEKNKSKMLGSRLSNAIAFSKERASQLEAATSKQMHMSTGITSAIARSKKKSAQINTLRQQLDSEKKKSKFLGSRLSNAIAFSKERATRLEAATSKQMAMSTGITGALAQSKRKTAKMSVLQQQLGSEKNKNKALSKRLRNAIAFSKQRATLVDSQQQEESDWAASVSANLDAAIGGVQGTTVSSNSDNSVNVQVGNNGLFRTGGTALSAGGSELLSTIAQQLSALDSNITVVGHTDNVPVGSSSRFSSNEELSLARALSTLQFLRNQGIQSEQLSAAGFGAGSPLAGNDTAEGRAQNRRVEIVLRKQ